MTKPKMKKKENIQNKQNKKDKKKWEYYQLDNGMKVVLYPTKNYNHVGIGAYIDFGQHDERNHTRQISHIIEHVIFDGTEELRSPEEIELYADKIAGSYNAQVGPELTEFSGVFSDLEVGGALNLLQELMFRPLLRRRDIEKERTIIQEEILMRWDSVPAKLGLKALWNRYKDKKHPFIFTVDDMLNSIKTLTHKKIVRTHQRYYTPDNTLLGIYGHFDIDEVRKEVQKKFGYLPKSRRKIKRVPFSKKLFSDYTVDVVKHKCEKVYLLINFPGFRQGKHPKKDLISHLMLELLVNKRDSKIYSSLREKLGLVYEVGGGFACHRKHGLFEITTSCRVEHFDTVLRTIVSSIEAFKQGRLSGQKLARVISSHQKTVRMSFDYPGQALGWLLMQHHIGGKIFMPEDYVKIEEEITKKDISAMASKVFDWARANIIVFSPDGKRRIEKSIKQVMKDLI